MLGTAMPPAISNGRTSASTLSYVTHIAGFWVSDGMGTVSTLGMGPMGKNGLGSIALISASVQSHDRFSTVRSFH